MKKRKLFIGIIVLVGITAAIYYFYLAKPSGFLTSEEILTEINRYSYDFKAAKVLDVIEIDDRHVFVPIITDEYKYGMSFWTWKKHKWQLEFDSNTGGPRVWRIDHKDPSSYKVFWNIHPDDQISYGELYFIRNRTYRGTDKAQYYFPRLQMKTAINFEEKPFGMMELPYEWQTVMGSMIKVEEARQSDSLFQSFYFEDVYFGWIPYNQEQTRQRADHTLNGGGGGGIDLLHALYLSEEELEYIDK